MQLDDLVNRPASWGALIYDDSIVIKCHIDYTNKVSYNNNIFLPLTINNSTFTVPIWTSFILAQKLQIRKHKLFYLKNVLINASSYLGPFVEVEEIR